MIRVDFKYGFLFVLIRGFNFFGIICIWEWIYWVNFSIGFN